MLCWWNSIAIFTYLFQVFFVPRCSQNSRHVDSLGQWPQLTCQSSNAGVRRYHFKVDCVLQCQRMSAIRRLQFLPVSLVHFDQCCQIACRFLAANLHWARKPISHILYSYANKIVCHVFIMRHSCMKYRFGWLIGWYTSAMLVAIPVSHLYTSRFREMP